jgi:hypothetical protein
MYKVYIEKGTVVKEKMGFPGVNKQTHPGILPVEIRTCTSCGEKPSESACSGRTCFSSGTSPA